MIEKVDKTTSDLLRWRAGEVPSASKLNRQVDAINELRRGLIGPRQRVPSSRPTREEEANGGIVFGRIVAIDGTMLVITPYTVDDAGNVIPDTNTITVFPWPNTTTAHFQQFVGTTMILPVVIINGTPFAMQHFRMHSFAPNTSVPVVDCPLQ